MSPADARVKPVAEGEKALERRRRTGRVTADQRVRRTPQQRRGGGEVPRVGHEIPVAREPPQPLHRAEIQLPVAQQLIRRVRAVAHLKLPVMAHDGCSAQSLEHAHLNLLRPQRHQPVEARREARQPFARQAHDEVRVQVCARVRPQPGEVLRELRVVLPARDVARGLVVEGLHADLQLHRARRELRQQFAQRLRQPVGNHLEVQEQPRSPAVEEELQDGPAHQQVQVERPVHELELRRPARQQPVQRR